MKNLTITATVILGVLNIGNAAAAAPAPAPAAAAPAAKDTKKEQTPINDKTNYQGDRLSFPVKIDAKIKRGDTPICIPANTSLRALGDDQDKDGTKYLKVIWTKNLIPFTSKPNQTCEGTDGTTKPDETPCEATAGTTKPDETPCEATDGTTKVDPKNRVVPKNEVILIEKDHLQGYGVQRWGFTYGALVVPFKYHLEGSRSFEGNSTVGPYLGYRINNQKVGLSVKAVGFIGAAAIRVNRTDENGNSDDETLAGFSYGVGAIGEVKSEFQFGIVFGQDRVSDGSDYEDNGKWWGAVALGFNFDN